MKLRPGKCLWTLTFFAITLGTGWSQEKDEQRPVTDAQDTVLPETAGPDAMPAPDGAGSDQSSTELPTSISRSYLLTGIHMNERADSRPGGIFGNSSQFSSVTDVLGSLSLLKVRRRSQTAIDYVGGATVYSNYVNTGLHNEQTVQLSADHSILWRRGRLSFSDSFRDLRSGDFGSSSFGGASAYNLRFTGAGASISEDTIASDFSGASQLGQLGEQSSLTNVSTVHLTQALTPHASASLATDYSFTDYLGRSGPLVGSRQVSAQAGYNYHFNRRDEIGVVYGYRTFQFPQRGGIVTNSVQVVYQRRVSGRMVLTLGAGPEFATVSSDTSGNLQQINATVQASLHYRLERSRLALSYRRLVSTGSGFFDGGNTNVVRFSLGRDLFRYWRCSFDLGYARVSNIAPASPSSPGTFGNSYQHGFAGAAVQRRLGRDFSISASYQFTGENFDSYSCGAGTVCDGVRGRHVASIGFDWNLRPRRLE